MKKNIKRYSLLVELTTICLLLWIWLTMEVEMAGTIYLIPKILGVFVASVIWIVYFIYFFILGKGKKLNDLIEYAEKSDLESSYENVMLIGGENCVDFFPKDIDSLNVKKYICEYITGKSIPSWQMELIIEYSDDIAFEDELYRIKKLSDCDKTNDMSSLFNMTVYIETWNKFSCYQYALVDEKEKRVVYVYMQNIKNTDMIIDKFYLPQGLYK